MTLDNRKMEYLLTIYDETEINHVLNAVAKDAVTVVAAELQYTKIKNEEDDNDETAKKVMLTVVDELADRIKTEVRYRMTLSDKLLEAEKKK